MKKRLIMSLMVIGLVSALVGGATFAWFTDTAVNEGNTFTAGTLKLDFVDDETTLPFNVTNMKPGQSETKSFTLKNDGSLPMKLKVQVAEVGDGILDEVLSVAVKYNNQVIFNGSMEQLMNGVEVTGFEFRAGETVTCDVIVTMATTADNTYQGATFEGTVTFTGTQTDNPGWDQ